MSTETVVQTLEKRQSGRNDLKKLSLTLAISIAIVNGVLVIIYTSQDIETAEAYYTRQLSRITSR